MQFDLALAAGVSRSAGSRQNGSLPTLLNVLQDGSSSLGLFGADLQAAQSERQRRREADAEALGAGHAGTSHPTEIIADEERNMRPGSRTFRREQVRDQARQTVQEQHEVTRDALRKTSASESGASKTTTNRAQADTPAKPSSPPASAQSSPTADSVAKALAASNGKTSSPATPAQQPTPAASRPTVTPPSTPSAATGSTTPTATAARAATANARVAALTNATAAARPVSAVAGARGTGSTTTATVGTARGASATSTTRAKATPTPAEAAPEESKTDANVERMLRMIHARIGKERSVATLRLDPPELGMVRLRMDLRNEQLSLRIETTTPQARRVLGEQLDALRKSLESAGIQLERVELHHVEAATNGPDPQDPQYADGGTGHHDPSARSGDDSAGGREQSPAASLFDEPALDVARDVILEPAAESLVNVLA